MLYFGQVYASGAEDYATAHVANFIIRLAPWEHLEQSRDILTRLPQVILTTK